MNNGEGVVGGQRRREWGKESLTEGVRKHCTENCYFMCTYGV